MKGNFVFMSVRKRECAKTLSRDLSFNISFYVLAVNAISLSESDFIIRSKDFLIDCSFEV